MDLKKFNKKRVLIGDIFNKKHRHVEIIGWVNNTRDLSKVKFLLLRDNSGLIQVTGIKGKTPESIFENMEKIPRESVVYVKGIVKNSKQAPGGKEINPDEIITL